MSTTTVIHANLKYSFIRSSSWLWSLTGSLTGDDNGARCLDTADEHNSSQVQIFTPWFSHQLPPPLLKIKSLHTLLIIRDYIPLRKEDT